MPLLESVTTPSNMPVTSANVSNVAVQSTLEVKWRHLKHAGDFNSPNAQCTLLFYWPPFHRTGKNKSCPEMWTEHLKGLHLHLVPNFKMFGIALATYKHMWALSTFTWGKLQSTTRISVPNLCNPHKIQPYIASALLTISLHTSCTLHTSV